MIYPSSLVTGTWQYVYALNPLVSVVNGVRWALLGAAAPEVLAVAISTAVALSPWWRGRLFRRTELFFADVV